jgi:2-polyprenyl-6-methoxyphenol hydroxylase-like FAD-dependent oxidoreductase
MHSRIVIVGAGPVGLVAASLLVDSGVPVVMLDASPKVI